MSEDEFMGMWYWFEELEEENKDKGTREADKKLQRREDSNKKV